MAQAISNLAIGAKVKFGALHGVPIIWRVADKNHAGYPDNSVTLVSDQLIKLMPYDAIEPHSSGYRNQKGNNRYIHSNIRQWMNSNAGAGEWYVAQHPTDTPPASGYVSDNCNLYDAIAGFLNGFSTDEQNALLDTTITIGRSDADGGGTETCDDKIFLLSGTEIGIGGSPVCGSTLKYFSGNSRVTTTTAQCNANSNYPYSPAAGAAWYYWLRDAYYGSDYDVYIITDSGARQHTGAFYCYYGLRPVCNLSLDLKVEDAADSDDCYTIIYNQAPTMPPTITVPDKIYGGSNAEVSWGSSNDADGNLSGYILEQLVDNGSWTQIYKGTTRAYSAPITFGWNTVQFRVKAYDDAGDESAYNISATRTVINNRPPVISGSDSNLGNFVETPPSHSYTITDADGDQVTVVEALDGVEHKSYTCTLGAANTFSMTADQWLKMLNGTHTLTITATDARGASTTRTLTFTKVVTSIEFEQTLAMAADDMPTKALVNIQGSFPAGSELKVWICNNGNDAAPTWQECTPYARNGQKIFFTNTTKTASAWGVKVKAKLLRGTATETCYIQSIGGNFA